jgi:hypothetical protein
MPLSDKVQLTLAEEVSKYYADPLGFVKFAFRWGEGDLAGFEGVDDWQRDVLNDIREGILARRFNGVDAVDPIQIAVSSGHG